MHIPCLIFSSQVHLKLVSPSSWTVGGFENGTVSLDSGKIVGRHGGIVAAAPGANRLNAPPIENHHECETKMLHVIEK